MRQSNRKTPAVFTLGLVLLCLVMFSNYMMGGLYARYVSTATASDEARVARFDVSSAKKTDVDFMIDLDFFDPKKQSDYIEFEVSSSSEVAVGYDVILILPEGMVELIEDGLIIVALDDGVEPTTVNESTRTVTFAAGTFNAAVAQSRAHKLTFSFKTGSMLNYTIRIEDPATLRVHMEQID